MRRIWIVGSAGSGKTTTGQTLARRIGVPHLELDSIFHQPGWKPLETEDFRRRVADLVRTDAWVIDGNYSAVADLVLDRADTVVWLDLTRPTVMRQLVVRTLRRVALRQELWNGNRERWRNLFSLQPTESILVWSWTNHVPYTARFTDLGQRVQDRGSTFVRLRSRAAIRTFLEYATLD